MKITRTQIRKILKEAYNSMSPASKARANSVKRKFLRMYPDANIGIDSLGGWITVNGVKAVNMSQASGQPISDEDLIEKMHVEYAKTHIDDDSDQMYEL
jgi:hypothetical protein